MTSIPRRICLRIPAFPTASLTPPCLTRHAITSSCPECHPPALPEIRHLTLSRPESHHLASSAPHGKLPPRLARNRHLSSSVSAGIRCAPVKSFLPPPECHRIAFWVLGGMSSPLSCLARNTITSSPWPRQESAASRPESSTSPGMLPPHLFCLALQCHYPVHLLFVHDSAK